MEPSSPLTSSSFRMILQEKEELIKYLKEEIIKRDIIISELQDKCLWLKSQRRKK